MLIRKSDIPQSWSALTWRQLCCMWAVKQRYGGNADAARAAALLALLGLEPATERRYSVITLFRHNEKTAPRHDDHSGEAVYLLKARDGGLWTVTARELSHMAGQTLAWFDFPYGDPGEEEQRDGHGKVLRERREAVGGYVSGMRDAMILSEETITVCRRHFVLPQVAMNNLTWQQYRSLQAVAPQLFADGIGDRQALSLQAQFMAYCLVPRSLALLDSSGRTVKVRPHWVYEYDADRAEKMVGWWEKRLADDSAVTLFHILFQVYQTSLSYYAAAYPLLFSGDNRQDQMRDALQGEVGTINTIMKYAGYSEQQQVYDSNLPFVLDILNTMTKEAKEIEKMNAKIKK